MSRTVLTTFLITVFLAAFTTTPEAGTNLNSSRSNCVKARGTWVTGRDGKVSCDLKNQPPTKGDSTNVKGKTGDSAGLAVSDPGAGGSKPTKSSK
jgi:hypothetical protein